MLTDQDALRIPQIAVCGHSIILSSPISAIRLEPGGNGEGKLGLLVQLAFGTSVAYIGKGFNDRTAKVYANNSYYFVFTKDLELQGQSQN
jgi:hypothetical protein